MKGLILKNDILCCPVCQNVLKQSDNYLYWELCAKKYPIEKNIIRMLPDLSKDLELSIEKWDKIYSDQLRDKTFYKEFDNYKKLYLQDTIDQLNDARKIGKSDIYLEIGCGSFFLGQELADKVELIIGIDICPSALEIAKKMLDEKGSTNYILIQGDILNFPIRSNSIDLIYGGGVIEHFRNTQVCVDELYRVLKIDGVSFNTVPYLNIGSLTYRQLWGNIPNVPILKQTAEFVHIKLLRGKHMTYGYEMSFLASTLKAIHKRAGFSNVKVDKFTVKVVFDFLPNFLKPILTELAIKSRLFWPMIKVVAKK